jgi:hypothetical protein
MNFSTASRILEPLLRTHKPLGTMPFRDLQEYIAFYWNRQTMACVIDYDEAAAICLIKLFRRLDHFLDPFIHDPCGRYCMIELMIAKEPVHMGIVWRKLVSRWGPQQIVLWDRGARTENSKSPRMYTWRQFEKLSRRMIQWDRKKLQK